MTTNSPNIRPNLPFGLSPRIPDLAFTDGQGVSGFGPYRDYNRNHNAFGNWTKTLGHQVRPYLGYASIDLFSPVFDSNYNGLQAQVRRQFSTNSTVTVNYIWSHALGTATNNFRAPQASYDIAAEYGNLDYDRRHIFSASYVYTLPFFVHQNGFAGHVLGGWEVAGILYADTGSHLTASLSRDPASLGLRRSEYF